MPGKYWNRLMEIAVDNGGYVTPTLAATVGVPAIELRKMVSRGVLEAAAWGVYRLPTVPHDRYDEFILAQLWAMGRGVISHDSALLIHELCDVSPSSIHITVPSTYRISKRGGHNYTVHHATLQTSETMRLDAVVLTNVQRTLQDCLAHTPTYLMRQAVTEATRRGAITSEMAEKLRQAGP